MTTKTEAVIRWSVKDGQPLATVEISQEAISLDEMRSLSFRMREIWSEMDWFQTRFLGAGVKHASKHHLLWKVSYEENNACTSLCGRQVEKWNTIFIITGEPNKGETCKKCWDAWIAGDLD